LEPVITDSPAALGEALRGVAIVVAAGARRELLFRPVC